MQYTSAYADQIFAYANNINTIEGGMHVLGFRTAVTNAVNGYARKRGMLKEAEPSLSTDDILEGLTAVVSVKLENPQFEGQTKTKLGNNKVRSIVYGLVNERLEFFFEENPKVARTIVDKCMQAQRAREAAKKARDLSRPQECVRRPGVARQAGGLQEQQSVRERDLSGRGRFGRRHRQGWSRSAHASDSAAAR